MEILQLTTDYASVTAKAAKVTRLFVSFLVLVSTDKHGHQIYQKHVISKTDRAHTAKKKRNGYEQY